MNIYITITKRIITITIHDKIRLNIEIIYILLQRWLGWLDGVWNGTALGHEPSPREAHVFFRMDTIPSPLEDPIQRSEAKSRRPEDALTQQDANAFCEASGQPK